MRSDLSGASVPSAKALALNPAAYNAAIEREWAGWQKTGEPKIDGQDPRRWSEGPTRDPLARPVPLSFIRFYYSDPKSMINATTGKPLSNEARADHFDKLLRWQLNNKTRAPLARPITVFHGPMDAAIKKALTTTAGAALIAVGAHYLTPAAPASAAPAAAPAVAPAATVAPSASTVATQAASAVSQAADAYRAIQSLTAAIDAPSAPRPVAINAPAPAPKPTPSSSLILPALLALAFLA